MAFDPISLIVEFASQIAVSIIDSDTASVVLEKKAEANQLALEAQENQADAKIYQQLQAQSVAKQQEATTLANKTITENKNLVFIIGSVFVIAFMVLVFVFSLIFGKPNPKENGRVN